MYTLYAKNIQAGHMILIVKRYILPYFYLSTFKALSKDYTRPYNIQC